MPPPLQNYDGQTYSYSNSYDGLPSSMQQTTHQAAFSPQDHFNANASTQSIHSNPRDHFNPNASTQSMNSNSIDILNTAIPKAGRVSIQKPTDSLAALVAKPVLRAIPWKEGKALDDEQILKQSSRIQTRGAFLLVTRGQVSNPPCQRCAETQTGRFSLCVSDEKWFKGACATCEMATRGNLCTLRKALEGRAQRMRS